ncbi:hypothetical protein [Nonomuraea sp. NPDC050643]|uniref:hypothetical protein n=1 Tax=Nonomuraea sp. NPDC050643 TaxID=3155660 RepID=UPI00340C8745
MSTTLESPRRGAAAAESREDFEACHDHDRQVAGDFATLIILSGESNRTSAPLATATGRLGDGGLS